MRLGERAQPSIRSFSRLVQPANPQRRHGGGIGASLGMLSRYLGNENSGPPPDAPEPPDRLLRVAARVLGVRLEWLRTGAGAMTAEEEKRQQAQRMTRPEDAGEEMHDGLLKAHGFDADHFYRQDESALVLDLAYRWSFYAAFRSDGHGRP